MSNNKKRSSIGLGYYIALGLCAVAIGVCGWMYTLDREDPQPQLNDPNQTVAGTVEQNVAAVATKPQQTYPTEDAPVSGMMTEPVEEPVLKTGYPLEGQTVAVYAMDQLGYNQTTRDWRTHNGMDIAAEAGSVVCAAADGTVYAVYEDETMGMTVVIRHADGYTTEYASLAENVPVTPGQEVTLGQRIGTVGCTALLETALGDHVHFGVTRDGQPMDPLDFLNMD